MKALIEIASGRVCQIEDDAEIFEVTDGLEWRTCDSTVTTEHTWNGTSFDTPTSLTLAGVKAIKKTAVDALYAQKIAAAFAHGGRTFDADKNAQDNVHIAISYGQLNSVAGATNRTWVLADNTTATLTWTEFRAMATALFERADALHGYARVHKDAIAALATVAAVDAYDITVGWGA